MPTSSATDSAAAAAAFEEATVWATIAARWNLDGHRDVWDDLPPVERRVIPQVDPGADLSRRASRWSYTTGRADLADLATFAAALARTEAEAWQRQDRVIATQAFEERRFLAGDRILPWAIPWLRAAARCFPEHRAVGEESVASLLDLGDRLRPAPVLTGAEGLFPPGYDSFGPADLPEAGADRLLSLWGGLVVFRRSLESITGAAVPVRRAEAGWFEDAEIAGAIGAWYEVTAMRWRRLADRHPGTARLWQELADRAEHTSEIAK